MSELLRELTYLLKALTRGDSVGGFIAVVVALLVVVCLVFAMREITLWWFGISKIHKQLTQIAELMKSSDDKCQELLDACD